MTIKEIIVPDIGDFDEVEIIEILVSEGDDIDVEDSLITVESDKASMEIPSSDAGKIVKLNISMGDSIKQGDVIATIEASDAVEEETPEPEPEAEVVETAPTPEPTPVETAAAPVASDPAKTVTKEILVPDIGDFDSVEIIEVLVAGGDEIEVEDSLITVESDKASMEIPSSESGKIIDVKVAIGEQVSEGSIVVTMEVTEGGEPVVAKTPATPQTPKEVAPAPSTNAKSSAGKLPEGKTSPTAMIDEVRFSKAYASPSIRKFARELGVDLGQVTGTSRKGRINKDDVKNFVKTEMKKPRGGGLGIEPMPEVDFSQWGNISSEPLSKINKLTGEYLHRSWVTVPHVTQFDEADITEMEAFRKDTNNRLSKDGVKITPLAFIIKAVVASLKAYPRFNSSLDSTGENLILKDYYHVGVAVDTPNGLVVPVIRDADQKSMAEISNEIRELAGKARDKKLKPSEMQGGCFTISSLGGIGGTKFTPIVNAPEVAILGVSRSKMEPQWNGSEFEPRLMLPLSLSYDHRVIDGADGARFTSHLNEMLSDIRRMMV